MSIPASTWNPAGVITGENFPVAPHLAHLHAYLLENRFIQCIRNYQPALLPIRSRDVLARIQSGDPSWEPLVPQPIVELIKRHGLFGHPTGQANP